MILCREGDYKPRLESPRSVSTAVERLCRRWGSSHSGSLSDGSRRILLIFETGGRDLALEKCEARLLVVLIKIREFFLKRSQLRQIVENDIRIIGMACEEILVVWLGGIEGFKRDNLGRNPSREDSVLAELVDISQRNLLLIL